MGLASREQMISEAKAALWVLARKVGFDKERDLDEWLRFWSKRYPSCCHDFFLIAKLFDEEKLTEGVGDLDIPPAKATIKWGRWALLLTFTILLAVAAAFMPWEYSATGAVLVAVVVVAWFLFVNWFTWTLTSSSLGLIASGCWGKAVELELPSNNGEPIFLRLGFEQNAFVSGLSITLGVALLAFTAWYKRSADNKKTQS